MANISKRGNTFRIRVYVGTDMNGKKIMKSTLSYRLKTFHRRKPKSLHRNMLFSMNGNAKAM